MHTALSFTAQDTVDGVCEQSFSLDGVPGVLWAPDPDPSGRPLVLVPHGGGPGWGRLVGEGRIVTAAAPLPTTNH
jgi:hypothetical protein